jgi:hypothetical protein
MATEVTHSLSNRRGRFSSHVTADASGWYWAEILLVGDKGIFVAPSMTRPVHAARRRGGWGVNRQSRGQTSATPSPALLIELIGP